MTPNYELAALKAAEILIQHNICTAPVDPLPILKKTPGVLVMTFEELSNKVNMKRKDVLNIFGCENQDAVTNMYIDGDNIHYTPYIMNLFDFQRYASLRDGSAVADFGTYMDGYVEV